MCLMYLWCDSSFRLWSKHFLVWDGMTRRYDPGFSIYAATYFRPDSILKLILFKYNWCLFIQISLVLSRAKFMINIYMNPGWWTAMYSMSSWKCRKIVPNEYAHSADFSHQMQEIIIHHCIELICNDSMHYLCRLFSLFNIVRPGHTHLHQQTGTSLILIMVCPFWSVPQPKWSKIHRKMPNYFSLNALDSLTFGLAYHIIMRVQIQLAWNILCHFFAVFIRLKAS